MAASKGELRFECAAKERTFEYSKLFLSPNIHCSVALIHKFADIPIHRYLFPNTADTDVFLYNYNQTKINESTSENEDIISDLVCFCY